ncbi:hypothetical protein B0J12DRAFT_705425 [Macrophomina phaseolina]|uniref:Integrase zinc-binding domain-containing protein n=1 Tax=Macrophomina phaseolina TaxID=35725 RepID=A0ABQ8FUX0_9PEZI|nr:hypothetical protein B0J12DRAFT_705425 [Macrophomina phaseolina]
MPFDDEGPPAASYTPHARLSSISSSVLGHQETSHDVASAHLEESATSVAPLLARPRNEGRSLESFNDASRLAFNAYLARGVDAVRHFNEEEYDDYVGWCSGRSARGEAQRSHMRLIQRNYVYYRAETNNRLGLYRRPIKSFSFREVLKKHEVFDAITQAHCDTGHGGKFSHTLRGTRRCSGDIH